MSKDRSKFSSFDKEQKIFDKWRNYLHEDEVQIKLISEQKEAQQAVQPDAASGELLAERRGQTLADLVGDTSIADALRAPRSPSEDIFSDPPPSSIHDIDPLRIPGPPPEDAGGPPGGIYGWDDEPGLSPGRAKPPVDIPGSGRRRPIGDLDTDDTEGLEEGPWGALSGEPDLGETPPWGKPELGPPELGPPELGRPELGRPELGPPERRPFPGERPELEPPERSTMLEQIIREELHRYFSDK